MKSRDGGSKLVRSVGNFNSGQDVTLYKHYVREYIEWLLQGSLRAPDVVM